MESNPCAPASTIWRVVGIFLSLHALVDVIHCVSQEGGSGLTEALWICTCTLHFAALAMLNPCYAPVSVSSCVMAVGAAHMGWIVETISYGIFGSDLGLNLYVA